MRKERGRDFKSLLIPDAGGSAVLSSHYRGLYYFQFRTSSFISQEMSDAWNFSAAASLPPPPLPPWMPLSKIWTSLSSSSRFFLFKVPLYPFMWHGALIRAHQSSNLLEFFCCLELMHRFAFSCLLSILFLDLSYGAVFWMRDVGNSEVDFYLKKCYSVPDFHLRRGMGGVPVDGDRLFKKSNSKFFLILNVLPSAQTTNFRRLKRRKCC